MAVDICTQFNDISIASYVCTSTAPTICKETYFPASRAEDELILSNNLNPLKCRLHMHLVSRATSLLGHEGKLGNRKNKCNFKRLKEYSHVEISQDKVEIRQR